MKISRNNWNMSIEKWGGKIILKKLKNKVPFDNEAGWNALRIRTKCGYCYEIDEQNLDCDDCILISKGDYFCNKHYIEFLKAMRKNNFAKAEWHRVRLYNQILRNEPNVYEEP